MAYNPYKDQQPVNIIDPSGRLRESGIRKFNFPYTPTVTNIINANYSQAATTHSNFQQSFVCQLIDYVDDYLDFFFDKNKPFLTKNVSLKNSILFSPFSKNIL